MSASGRATSYKCLPPFAATAGAKRPRIVLCGEAWGEQEELTHQPFVGASGKELFRMLGEALPEVAPERYAAASQLLNYGAAWVKERGAWLEAAGIAMTNVLAFRPPGNRLESLCVQRKDAGAGANWPAFASRKYLREDFLPEIERLQQELQEWRPNIVIALGNSACWALLQATNIGSIRGAVAEGHSEGAAPGMKILPTYHPAGVLRQWQWRPIVVADLLKGIRESDSPAIRRPARRILINPSLAELRSWVDKLLTSGPRVIAADTETEAGQITCISFAASPTEAIVVPFWDKTQPGYSYWSEAEEPLVWEQLDRIFNSPQLSICWQNGLYDMQYCWPMQLSIARSTEDTMLLHHSLFPEMKKGLGFLGSLYSSEASWKLMRRWKPDTEKRDE